MPHDLRVTALQRPPRQKESSWGSDASECAASDVASDDDWVDSSVEVSSSTSSATSQSKQGRSGGLTYPRSLREDAQDHQLLQVHAPPLGRLQFKSWDDFDCYLRTYMQETYQSFRVRTNNTVAARNNKIRSSRSKQPVLPDEWVNYGKTFVCTHSGRYKARGKGKRKRMQSRAMDCRAQINACVRATNESSSSDGAEPTFVLEITPSRLVHNHSLNKHTYDQYSHNRTALEPDVLETVNELRKAGAQKKRILQYIQEHSVCNPKNQDVHNLVRKLKKKSDTASTSAKRLKQWMIEFSEEPGNIGRIFVDSVQQKTIATCITLQTKHMRELFDCFPEVLMIDATHGTNVSKYKVFSIMAHDVFGKGQFVQHAVVQNERRPTLLTALEEFTRNNPAWPRIKCILIDKDFTEISVLKVAFPDALLLLCQFHVIKYLREEIASAEYGFSTWQKQQLQGIVNLLVYSKTEREYKKYRKYMRYIVTIGRGRQGVTLALASQVDLGELGQLGSGARELGSVGREMGTDSGGTRGSCDDSDGNDAEEDSYLPKHPFEVYLKKNWDSCRSMWCSFERQNAVTLGNNTNNRIEASWKQLKDLVNSFMGVDECIASIMCYQSQEEKKFLDSLYKLTRVHNSKYDHEMQFVANLVSEHACELIYEQYLFATTRAKYKYYEPVPDVFLVQYDCEDEDALDEPRSEYSVTKRDWSCSCLFMTSRLLPCRHVFFLRKELKMESVIPTHMINPKWLLASLLTSPELPEFTGDSFVVSRVLQESNLAWDSNRKFREANVVASTISEHLSGLGMKEYKTAMKALREVAIRFKHGEYAAMTLTGSSFDHVSAADDLVELDILEGAAASGSMHGDSAASSVETTQLGTDVGELGTDTAELGADGAELGAGCAELGADGAELGADGAELGADTTELVSESREEITESTAPSATPARPVHLDDENDVFEIQSPPKPRGRPKQKPKAVKAKRNLVIAMVQEDMEMHENQMNLLSLYELLDSSPTYNSSREKLFQFKLYSFLTKPKPPIAHEISKLPATKPLVRPQDIVRIFPMDLIKKCMAKVTAYQRKRAGIRELDIALEIVGLGVFATSTVALMKKWHTASSVLKKIDKALVWMKQIDFTCISNSSFSIGSDKELPEKLKNIPILSTKANVLDLTAKECLTDEIMHLALLKKFESDPNVVVFEASSLGVVVDGAISADTETIRRALSGLTNEKVLFPLNCNDNHWCSVMMDLEKGKVVVYDSSASSYLMGVRTVAHALVALLPSPSKPSARLQTYESGLGVQVDSYNCGIYVLLAFEMFCGAEPLGHLDKKSLQCLRYRYLHMCMQV